MSPPTYRSLSWPCRVVTGTARSASARVAHRSWAALVARKYRAWVHPTALDALALWFVAETKVDWAQAHPRDPALRQQLEVEVLPALSMANVRALLQAVLPLQQLSPNQATRLVITHLVHRARSTCSRLKAQHRNRGPT